MEEEDDDFFDTISVNSVASSRRKLHPNKDYISLSRNTIYYSAFDIDGGHNNRNSMELSDLDGGGDGRRNSTDKVFKHSNKDVKTYSQWRDRRWRSFTEKDLVVDFVLAYNDQDNNDDDGDELKRKIFENNLEKQGLILERETNQRIHFVKIHVPKEVLSRYSAILKLRLPIKKAEQIFDYNPTLTNKIYDCLQNKLFPKQFTYDNYRLTAEYSEERNYLAPTLFCSFSTKGRPFSLYLDPQKFDARDYIHTAFKGDIDRWLSLTSAPQRTFDNNVTDAFTAKELYLRLRQIISNLLGREQFDVDEPDFFNAATHIIVASYILGNEKYGNEDTDKGIKRLLAEGVYKAAYPLHEGDINSHDSHRKLLLDEWASVSKWIKYQPIDDIKDYFGVKYALYFSWLGFYTHMLIPAAVVGIFCIIYAATTLNSNELIKDICKENITMCPRCDKYCDYWNIRESCTYSKVQHLVDNPATIFFAVFMSIWSAIYIELWKRYSAGIMHRWGLTGFDLLAEPPRPEYLVRLSNAKKRKLNVITLQDEPAVPFWKVKLPSLILSFTVVFFYALIAVAVVFGIVIYRITLTGSDKLYEDRSSYTIYVLPVTVGILNLVCIVIMNFFYNRLAVWLTEMELQRTQTEYEESLALKVYLFQFVNYYSSIFYIAFLKGKFVGYPTKYNKLFGYFRQEECNPGGCLMELTIQLAIIMIGNQFINAVQEMVLPLLYKLYNTFKVTTGIKKAESHNEEVIISCNQWTEDYKLSDIESQTLFSEYMEMVLQYGFITIFVTAFPLAPLFALINNILEMRLDAKKFIKYFRRPVPQRVRNIGVWLPVLASVARISVISNAMIIAFSSNFIPLTVYTLKVSPTHNESDYLNFTLSIFKTSDFPNETAPIKPSINPEYCAYSEYRNPPWDEHKYKRPLIYWHILAARLAFVVAYQNIVNFIITAVEWMIPDIPRKLNDQIKREAYKVNEMVIKYETDRAKGLSNKDQSSNGSVPNPERRSSLTNRSNRNTIYHDAEDT